MRILRHLSLGLFIVIAVACGIPSASAQTDSGSIAGLVTDFSGAVVRNAVVVLNSVDRGTTTRTKTNESGIYVLPSVAPGRYSLSVSHAGFRQVDLTQLVVNVQSNIEQNFKLQVGSVSESVTVEASGNNINTTDASVSTVIDRQFVENMPLNGRSFQDLLTLAPGVVQVPGGTIGGAGEITVNGQRTEANYFTVDGISANVGAPPGSSGNSASGLGGSVAGETALGTTQSLISVDALQEFRATTSTNSAEYGRTPGGQFSFTTRSGTNEWHGAAFDYFRNEAMDAENWFNGFTHNPTIAKQKERQNDFGGTLGGVIRIPGLYDGRGKTFFFFSYEGLRLWTPQATMATSVPDTTLRQNAPAALQPILASFPLPNAGEDGLNDGLGIYKVGLSAPSSIDAISVRIDHEVNDKVKIFGRYGQTPTITSAYSGSDLSLQTNSAITNRLVTLGLTSSPTGRQTNEFRVNFTQDDAVKKFTPTNLGGATPFLGLNDLPGPNGKGFPEEGSEMIVDLVFGGRPAWQYATFPDRQKQINITDSHNWSLGRHVVKFGFDWRRLTTYIDPVTIAEEMLFRSEAEVLANSPSTAEVQIIGPQPEEPVYTNVSLFVQDEWKASTRLSLSMGLRWDVNPAPGNLLGPVPYTLDQVSNLATAKLAPAGTPLWHTDWHGFAPRLGAAYQLSQQHKHETVLRGGFGIFYDLGSAQGSDGYAGGPGIQSTALLSGASFPFTSAQLDSIPAPSVLPPYTSGLVAFDPNLSLPYTLQWNVAVQQALGSQQSATVSYVGAAGRRLLTTFTDVPALYGNPNFSSNSVVELTKNDATSDYNALQLQFQRQLSRGLQALVSYTWSHSIDEESSNFFAVVLERASSDFDIRHNFQAALTYDVKGNYENRFLSATLLHWGLDTRISARSALPVDIYYASSTINPLTFQQQTLHPNLVLGAPLYLRGSQYPGGKLINYSAFTYPTSGQPSYGLDGNTPRNFASAFGAWQADVAVRREFPVYERLRLQFRAEAFNLFNHPNFGAINAGLTAGPYNPSSGTGFGVATGTLNSRLGGLNSLYQVGGPRSLQLALKLIF